MMKPFNQFFSKSIFLKSFVFIILSAFARQGYSQTTNLPTFNHAALCATDLKKTTAFYVSVMQLQLIANPFKDTVHSWFKIGPGLALHVIQGKCTTTIHEIAIHLCFSVPSLDGFIKHLEQMNITYGNWTGELKKIQKRTDGVLQIYLQDPDGNWIEVNDAK